MRIALLLFFFAACGYAPPAPVILGPDGGVIANCDVEWCQLELPDGGTRMVGAP